MDGFVTRFAPSPTGFLHLGHAYSALMAYRMAQYYNGRFLLRIEDIDHIRCKPEFVEAIQEDLRWLGIEWEEPIRLQSQHFAAYEAVIQRLARMGIVYPCFCSRKDVEQRLALEVKSDALSKKAIYTPDGALRYDEHCRALSIDEQQKNLQCSPFSWRINMTKALQILKEKGQSALSYHSMKSPFGENGGRENYTHLCEPHLYGDVVIARKDIMASYYLATTHDDAVQGVTHIVRGKDLQASTDIQRLLQVLMGWSAPVYYHHHIMNGSNGKKLSKTAHSPSLRSMRKAGLTAQTLIRKLSSFDKR